MCIEKYHPFKNWFGSTTGAKEGGAICFGLPASALFKLGMGNQTKSSALEKRQGRGTPSSES